MQRHFDRDEPRPVAPTVAARPFQLYPEERHWWSFSDYGAVLGVMRQLRPKRVLEFGPGSSTLALIEGGAERIDTVEDDASWAEVYEDRLVKRFPTAQYPTTIALHRYTWSDPLSIPMVDRERYDLALIDGPLGTDRRATAVRYALARALAVLAPTETKNPELLTDLKALATELGAEMQVWETGPLSGGFALLMLPTPAPAAGEHAEHSRGDAPAPAVAERNVDPADLIIPEPPPLQTPDVPALEKPVPAPLSKRQQKKQQQAAKRQQS